MVHVLHKTYNYEVLCHRSAVTVGKCTNKYAVLKCRIVVFFCLRGIRLFSVPFYPSERSAGDARGEGKEKNEASTNFLLPFVRLSHFSRFAKMKPKRLIHRLLTFLILFCVLFLCFLFVCSCLFIYLFFCRSHYRCRHRCQRFLIGCLTLC